MGFIQKYYILGIVFSFLQYFCECLDWQNSQFINIVGKDDISAAIEVKGWRLRDIRA
jgi:hypothetical protein